MEVNSISDVEGSFLISLFVRGSLTKGLFDEFSIEKPELARRLQSKGIFSDEPIHENIEIFKAIMAIDSDDEKSRALIQSALDKNEPDLILAFTNLFATRKVLSPKLFLDSWKGNLHLLIALIHMKVVQTSDIQNMALLQTVMDVFINSMSLSG